MLLLQVCLFCLYVCRGCGGVCEETGKGFSIAESIPAWTPPQTNNSHNYHICDAIKQNEFEVEKNQSYFVAFAICVLFNL